MTRFAASMALLRGAILLAVGLFALVSPLPALTLLLMAGGIVLIVDGALGLAALDYAAPRGWPFWVALVRSVLAIIAGLAVLFSPYLVPLLSLAVLATLVAAQAIVIGLIEIVMTLRDRHARNSIWPALGGAALYVAIGLVLLFIPFASATLLMQIGGGIVALFALLHVLRTWKAIRASGPKVA